jgi:hypothetical protein
MQLDLNLPEGSPWSTLDVTRLVQELTGNILKTGEEPLPATVRMSTASVIAQLSLTRRVGKLEATFPILKGIGDEGRTR